MRTKTLLLTAALGAAGIATSMAQVYSANVVGYVNQVLPAETLVAVGNPLNAPTNDLNTVLGGMPAKSSAQFWTGSGFTPSTKGTTWDPNIAIPPGVGFFVNSKSAYTNTYVGEVAAAPGGSVTNSLPAETLVMVSSMLPFAGDLNDANLNLVSVPAKSSAQFWNGAGYTPSTKGTTWDPAEPLGRPLAVAEGFFLNSKAAHDWVQTLPAN